MAGEIISLISSSPDPRVTEQLPVAPSNPRKRLSDTALLEATGEATGEATDSRAPIEKRPRLSTAAIPPCGDRSFIDSLDLSDLSDPVELPSPAREPEPKPSARDTALRDVGEEISNSRAQSNNRARRSARSPRARSPLARRRTSFLDSLNLSDLSDPVELPSPAKQPNRRPERDTALRDITHDITNSQERTETRARRPAASPPRGNKSFLDSLDLSDLSDPVELSSLAKQPNPRALAKDPARVFRRERNETGRTSTKGPTAGLETSRLPAFDDPIELSSSPDRGRRRKPEPHFTSVEKNTEPERFATDPFSFSPSPERRPRTNRGPRTGIDDLVSTRNRRPSPPWDTGGSAYRLDSPSPLTAASPPRLPREWDPISSSAPKPRETSVIDLDSDKAPELILSDESFPDLVDIRPVARTASLDPIPPPTRRKAGATLSRASAYTSSTRPSTVTTTRPAAPRTTTTAPKKTAEERVREKDLRTAAREAEQARKKQEREEARALKIREKERAAALAEVNKVRTDKKISAREMIVDIPSSLDDAVALQTRTLLAELGVEDAAWESPVARVVRWRRKVRSEFREELGYYEPVPERIEKENFALAVMKADEFVDLCMGVEGRDLERHVRMMKQHFPGHEMLYLIEGLDPWMRKNRNLRNRQFVAAVRGAESSSVTTAAAARRRNPAREYVDEEMVEDALLELQIRHGAKIHHAAMGIETARWIVTFTQHISTVPYRRRRDEANASAAAFCMDAGQVRSGEDSRDAYVRMLQEVNRVTAPVAYGVAAEFGTVSQLVRGLEARGPLALAECRKGVNREGELGERMIGQALSRRIHKVFTGTDEESTDV
ncbi:uncharacterized protein DNG_06305 [Cephalotrichum gorgonifer]|uniref:ERCC4 domain-containing protein n=1 Tax=Cephalotrichum gorgonifer TaxID=2041049 RepID=A0AAE8MZR6_9PEZI|nr:uncharacterized protein DNG_06305 [Cephalotrichum gorgonifer]